MNKFYLIAFLLMLSAVLQNCQNPDNTNLSPDLIENPKTASGRGDLSKLPKFQFKEKEHDFGKIVEGVEVSYTFKFKNVGGSDLIIHQVKPNCGCTASSFTRTPVPPGGEGKIVLTFNSLHYKGINHKVAHVVANTQPSTEVLKITALVVDPSEL